MSNAAQRNISVELPTITIFHLDRLWLMPVMQACDETWMATGDILTAWSAANDKAACERKDDKRSGGSVTETRVRRGVTSRLKKECEMAGWTTGNAEYELAIKAVRVDIARIFAEADHHDQITYTKQYTLQDKQVDLLAGEKKPLDCSGDAVWPGNIAVTSMVLNFANHIHIPCLLKMLSWYLLNVIDLFKKNEDRVALADSQ
ncbi:hypothetical protein D6C87_00626 [Aureobasidium pullulans]|uniref:Uncharacterized protein n=1 Tax=Aureobasidium pullulans TaxID=5580 RepID=A0AB38M9U8_AURPU|nr:hypothetical protein D6C94_01326 [Aureobasidium pullulans]THZ48499.1 hypothetical protein D6C87_00626 [Aureobasidium pullulans]THZ93031.1 hypothetical protein D6C88_02900 [Aureobasidium pullulans]